MVARDDAPHSIQLKVMDYPKGFHGDVADLLNTPGGPETFGRMIREAKPHVTWMIDHLDDRHDVESPIGAADACEDMIDVLLRQPPVARAKYVQQLAAKLNVPEKEVRQTLNQIIRERGEHYEAHPEDRPNAGFNLKGI